MVSPGQSQSFEDGTAVKQLSSHTYESHFYDAWCIGTVPHGGYVTSIFQRVASTHFNTTLAAQNQPHTITLHLDFLRRTQAGPALFTVRDIKLGRQASVIHVTLTQAGREEIVGYITNSNMHTETGVSLPTSWSLNPAPLPVSFDLLLRDQDKNWFHLPEMPFAPFRKATQRMEFYLPRQVEPIRRNSDQWVTLKGGEKWTNESLGFVCDMWITPVETLSATQQDVAKRVPMWYPTVLLNLDIKKLLPEGGAEWLFVRVETKQVKNGRMDLEVVILDETGDIVALSHHVALAVSAERNAAERTTGASKI
ncbi:Uncharacterized protein BP5553_07757 [Venustampulla echinocandica]|uniref:Thioesterase family protein n=1 Tax=Venustampulla echinocandica TaxID=2656787 RepID=A0A370THF6_9HELO|nr:Uncharacterized protein BP5553_07757 [Venustampulla echinocandica]RDL34629.1 Uncharacterized protein BP5553_07757 [Venustampulla echinocandica]